MILDEFKIELQYLENNKVLALLDVYKGGEMKDAVLSEIAYRMEKKKDGRFSFRYTQQDSTPFGKIGYNRPLKRETME